MRLGSGFFQHRAVSADDAMQKLRLGSYAALPKRRIARRDIDGSHFVRAERDCRRGTNIVAQSHLPRDLHHATVSDRLGHFHGRHVERVG